MSDDRARVAALLGREPQGDFEVVVRDEGGDPVVIRNAPFLDDGTPMPTRFWLLHRPLRLAIDRLESGGGVRAAEAAIDPAEVADAHRRYGAERDAAVPPGVAGTSARRWGGRDPHRSEVPPRPLRLVPGRRR